MNFACHRNSALVMMLLGLSFACSAQAQDVIVPLLPLQERSASPDSTATVEPQKQPRLEVLGCILEPSVEVQISSPVAGVISSVPVKRGEHVSKGKVLFRLHAGVEAAAVDIARVKARFAERKKERNKELFEEDLLSPHERDEIETEMQMAQTELVLKEQELALRTAYSPASGVITERHFGAGEYVSVDPVVSLATLDPLHVDLLLPASRFGLLSKGDRLVVYPEAPVNGEYEARVDIVDPLVDPASGTFRVQLVLPNPGMKLPAGIRCSVGKPTS